MLYNWASNIQFWMLIFNQYTGEFFLRLRVVSKQPSFWHKTSFNTCYRTKCPFSQSFLVLWHLDNTWIPGQNTSFSPLTPGGTKCQFDWLSIPRELLFYNCNTILSGNDTFLLAIFWQAQMGQQSCLAFFIVPQQTYCSQPIKGPQNSVQVWISWNADALPKFKIFAAEEL